MKSILVATDGSANGRRAVKVAGGLAGALGARLGIVYVNDQSAVSEDARRFAELEWAVGEVSGAQLPGLILPAAADMTRVGTLDLENARVRALLGQAVLDEAAGQAKAAGARDVTTLLRDGNPVEEILAAARESEADLIVTGRRGLGTFAKVILGSVSQKIVDHAHTDVLCVRPAHET